MDEDGNVKNGVGGQMMELNHPMEKKRPQKNLEVGNASPCSTKWQNISISLVPS